MPLGLPSRVPWGLSCQGILQVQTAHGNVSPEPVWAGELLWSETETSTEIVLPGRHIYAYDIKNTYCKNIHFIYVDVYGCDVQVLRCLKRPEKPIRFKLESHLGTENQDLCKTSKCRLSSHRQSFCDSPGEQLGPCILLRQGIEYKTWEFCSRNKIIL